MKATRIGAFLSLDGDKARVEEGPALKRAVATAELLSDDNTASHYFEGVRDVEHRDAEGKPYTVRARGNDALGKAIKIGEEMSYLDYGGHKAAGERCFYAYVRRDIDPTQPYNEDGSENRYYVPEHVRNAKVEGPRSRTHMTYVFDEVGTAKTEEAAIAICEKALGKSKE